MNISWALGFIFEDFALGDVWEAILAAIIIAIVFFGFEKEFLGFPTFQVNGF
ncbi:hypothetical protein [Acinetobacter sp. NBRC 100985]|uniref:hypothetical protein n=1 Tax=Acinetobacter sp. NBRC 100985 TaxID=1071390 RepID=UPI000235F258|nr:hypothetical protein [Acinetobacter sp. NBRC 100985]GAB01907.1 hypothetical protein ACT4_023_00830 [Acinetobacter sp. NBRC 100985]